MFSLCFIFYLLLFNTNYFSIKVSAEKEIDYSETKIRINEILPNPDGKDSGNEFIEIYIESKIDLTNLKLSYRKLLKDNPSNIWSLNDFEIEDKYILINPSNLINSGAEIILYYNHDDDNKDIISQFKYTSATSGQSWNYDKNNWYEETPTPNEKNNDNPEKKDYSETKIRINEILANPNDGDSEFIELYNYGDKEIDLTNWILKDETKSKLKFNNVKIKSGKKIAFSKGDDFSFALNNSGGETVYLIAPNEKIFLEKSYTTSTKGISWNYDKNNWYEATPTPNDKNTENPTTKKYPKIIINEVLPNPNGTDTENEFIELYNPNDETVDLTGWILKDNSSTKKVLENIEIKPFEYLILYQKKDFSFSLNNDTDTIYLKTPNPNIETIFTYENPIESFSMNFDKSKNYSAEPTPNEKNNENPLTKKHPDLQLSEILPNPIGEEKTDEFIEIYNPNNFEINLENWMIKDSSKTGNYTFTENQKISANSYFTIYRKTFDFALNNSGGETVTLTAPNQKIKSEISYKSARENISYNFNLDEKNWRWSKFLTPNAKNKFNNLPEIKKFSVDENSYKNTYANFKVEVFDIDDEELKIRWDFGDGRKSYKAETKHKYIETGIYHGSLHVQDGSEEVMKNFTIEVKKYPKYKIEIIKIVPNPKGKDSGNEYLVIENKSKEKINLEGWSIATGSKKDKLTNHPIKKSLKIGKGKSEKITREYSAISLPNKKGFIELRQPDGKVIDKVSYEKEKIKNDESYEKINSEWQWILNGGENDLNDPEVQKIIAQALANEKGFQDELFMQSVAMNLVNKNKNIDNKKEISIKSKNSFGNFLEKINLLLNKNFLPFENIKNTLANVFKENYLAWFKNKALAFIFIENRNFTFTKIDFGIVKFV